MYESNYDCIWLQLSRTSRIYECLSEIGRKAAWKLTLSQCFVFAPVIIEKNSTNKSFWLTLLWPLNAPYIRFFLRFSSIAFPKRISPVRFSGFKNGYMKWHFIPWHPGSTRQRLENGDHWRGTKYGVFRNNILLSYERCCRRYMSNIIDSSALIFLSLVSFFLSMVNIRRHFDWKCHRQLLRVTHLWKILLSWLQFYAVERANCKKLQR